MNNKSVAKSPAETCDAGNVRFRRFLVPIDFSEASLNALRQARLLAVDDQAELTLLNVIEPPLSSRTLDRVGQAAARQQERLAQLESLARREVGSVRCVRTVVCDGSPAEEIAGLAARNRTDLIIVGRHSRRRPWRWLRGHTTNRLLKHAPCPVMVLRD